MTHRPTLALVLGLLGIGAATVGHWLPRRSPASVWSSALADAQPLPLAPYLEHAGERLAPSTMLPAAHTTSAAVRAYLLADCDNLPELRGDRATVKLARFRRAMCSGEPVSRAMLTTPPAMHPMGGSYAHRAGAAAPRHVEEQPGHLLATLSPTSRTALVQGHLRVAGPRWVVERQGEEWVGVSRSRVERSLARHGFSLGDATRPQQLRPIARSWVLPGAALGGLGLLVSVVLLVLERRSSARAHEQAQQFVLHALTHELRSPATASRLALEQLRPHYDLLPEDAAEAFLALTRANTRLNRTLAETGTLLSLRSGHCPVQPAACALQDVFDELGEDVETDVTLHTDPQLLALVLGNVLANAHRHGAPPVTVQAARTSKGARIVIGDAGEWRQPLADVLNPFARDSEQDGLGLGLALMDHGVALLGGRWTLDYTPTRFTLLLPDLAS